jgi:hypothetical protein
MTHALTADQGQLTASPTALDESPIGGPPNIGGKAGWDFPETSTLQSDKIFQICQFSSG